MPLPASHATIRISRPRTTYAMAAADVPALLIVVLHRLPALQATAKMVRVALPIMHRTGVGVTTAMPPPRTMCATEKERARALPTVVLSQQHAPLATLRTGAGVSLTTLRQALDATMVITPPIRMFATALERVRALPTAVLRRRHAHRVTPRTVTAALRITRRMEPDATTETTALKTTCVTGL